MNQAFDSSFEKTWMFLLDFCLISSMEVTTFTSNAVAPSFNLIHHLEGLSIFTTLKSMDGIISRKLLFTSLGPFRIFRRVRKLFWKFSPNFTELPTAMENNVVEFPANEKNRISILIYNREKKAKNSGTESFCSFWNFWTKLSLTSAGLYHRFSEI